MHQIGNIELSNKDFKYLVDGLKKLTMAYNIDKSSTRDINFIRQMMILQKKLELKQNKSIKQ